MMERSRSQIVRLVAACLHAFPLTVPVLPELVNTCSSPFHLVLTSNIHKSKTYSKHAYISVVFVCLFVTITCFEGGGGVCVK